MTSILGIVGGLVAGVGQLYATEASAQMEEANADQAKLDARYARQAAQVDSEYIMEEGKVARASARAATAAQGASTSDEGSPLIALMDMAAKERRAVMRRQYSGEVEAAKFLTEASFYKQRAENIRITGTISSLSTALSGPGVRYEDSGSRAAGGGYKSTRGGTGQGRDASTSDSLRSGYGRDRASSTSTGTDIGNWGDYL